MRFLRITAIVQRAKDIEILYFRRLLNSNVWSLDCGAKPLCFGSLELFLEPCGYFGKSFKGAVFGKGGGSQEDLFLPNQSRSWVLLKKEQCVIWVVCCLFLYYFIRYVPWGLPWEANVFGEGVRRSTHTCLAPPSRETQRPSLLTNGTRR